MVIASALPAGEVIRGEGDGFKLPIAGALKFAGLLRYLHWRINGLAKHRWCQPFLAEQGSALRRINRRGKRRTCEWLYEETVISGRGPGVDCARARAIVF